MEDAKTGVQKMKAYDQVEYLVMALDALGAIGGAVKAGKAWTMGRIAKTPAAGTSACAAFVRLDDFSQVDQPIWIKLQRCIEIPMRVQIVDGDWEKAAQVIELPSIKKLGGPDPGGNTNV